MTTNLPDKLFEEQEEVLLNVALSEGGCQEDKAIESVQFNRAIPSDPDWGLGIWTGKFDESSNGSKDLELLSLAIKTD
jgi:hypothetical protein